MSVLSLTIVIIIIQQFALIVNWVPQTPRKYVKNISASGNISPVFYV